MNTELVELERHRLDALRQCNVLDTPRESSFDGIVFTAAQVFRTPFATLSLVDENRIWFKARVGFNLSEIAREGSFCTHLIGAHQPIVIDDTLRDRRFAQLPYVTGPPYIRFFAGAPVTGPDGAQLGGLCVFDTWPRALSDRELIQLAQLARETSNLLLLRVAAFAEQFSGDQAVVEPA